MPSARSERRFELSVVRAGVPAVCCESWLALARAAVAHAVELPSERVSVLVDQGGLDVRAVWRSMPTVRELCTDVVGGAVVIDLDQSWIRHQPAPADDPAGRHPHRWHQDGALRFDFLAAAGSEPSSAALLRMATCWIALTPCGIDAASLELVSRPIDRLLAPTELREEVVAGQWPEPERVRPVFAPGDVAVFTGDVLHRTHVTPAMVRSRTSLELRCFPADAIPPRLRGDRFLVVAG